MSTLNTIRDVLAIIRDLLIIGVTALSLLLTWKIYVMVDAVSASIERGEFPFANAAFANATIPVSSYQTATFSLPSNVNITGESGVDAEISSLLQGAVTGYLRGDREGGIDSLNQLEDILRRRGDTVFLIKVRRLKNAMEEDSQGDVVRYGQEIASYISSRSQ